MQKKYGKSWYRTATFVQKTTDFDKDGKQEGLDVVRGSFRTRFATALTSPDQGRQRQSSSRTEKIFSFKDGKQESTRPFVHPLMILGF